MKTMESPKSALISYRADILAQVALTRREDIRLSKFDIGLSKTDNSAPDVDFIGTINPDDTESVAGVFAVAVWGTDKAINTEAGATRWLDHRLKQKQLAGEFTVCHLPSIALLFSMVGDTGYYAWILEPMLGADEDAPELVAVHQLKCHTLDKKALDEIVKNIKGWYRRLPVVSQIPHQRSIANPNGGGKQPADQAR